MKEFIANVAFDLRIERRMHLHVFLEVLVIFELFQTFRASYFRLQRRMYVQDMPLHVMSRFERHIAEYARMPLDGRVLEVKMPIQIQGVLVQFMTQMTFVLLLVWSVAVFYVVLQLVRYREFLPALVTFDLREGVGMDSLDVHMQSPSCAELLQTKLAVTLLHLGIVFVHTVHVQIMLVFESFVAYVTNNGGFLRGMDSGRV